jgi:hypothetical protein
MDNAPLPDIDRSFALFTNKQSEMDVGDRAQTAPSPSPVFPTKTDHEMLFSETDRSGILDKSTHVRPPQAATVEKKAVRLAARQQTGVWSFLVTIEIADP